MENQVLHTVWCNISGEATGEIWNGSLLGLNGLKRISLKALKMGSHKDAGCIVAIGSMHAEAENLKYVQYVQGKRVTPQVGLM